MFLTHFVPLCPAFVLARPLCFVIFIPESSVEEGRLGIFSAEDIPGADFKEAPGVYSLYKRLYKAIAFFRHPEYPIVDTLPVGGYQLK